MRKIKTPLILITLFFLNGCNLLIQNKTESSCDSTLKNKRLINTMVDLYEIDTVFYKYLDTVVDYEIRKQYYNECYSSFLFSTSLVQRSDTSSLDEILISTINRYMYDYSRCYGIFNYKGHVFLCDSLCDQSLLKKTNKKITLKYFEMNKYLWQIDIGDNYSTWYFINRNRKIVRTGHYFPLD